MKEFMIEMDVTFSARMHIEASTEAEAKKIATERMWADPRYHTRMGAIVDVTVTDCFED